MTRCVLQLSKFYPPDCGGIESVARELAVGLAARGWDSRVLCAGRGRHSSVERDGSVSVYRAASAGTLLSTSVSTAFLRQARRLLPDADIAHVHMPNPLAALAIWLARPTCRVVVHWHSDVVRQQLALKAYGPLQRWLLARADRVIATSQAYADTSEALAAWRAKVSVVPIGIGDNASPQCTAFAGSLRAAWGSRKVVFALGRLVNYKGFDVLVKAAAHLDDGALVLIGGTGPCEPALREQVRRLGLQGRVQLLGRIEDDELMSYHLAADVFCLPSRSRAEAFGVAALEAMSMGRPVVGTDVGGAALPWIINDGETGWVVPVDDDRALATALGRLLADGALRRRMGEAARRRFLDLFTAERMVAGIEHEFGRVLRPQ